MLAYDPIATTPLADYEFPVTEESGNVINVGIEIGLGVWSGRISYHAIFPSVGIDVGLGNLSTSQDQFAVFSPVGVAVGIKVAATKAFPRFQTPNKLSPLAFVSNEKNVIVFNQVTATEPVATAVFLNTGFAHTGNGFIEIAGKYTGQLDCTLDFRVVDGVNMYATLPRFSGVGNGELTIDASGYEIEESFTLTCTQSALPARFASGRLAGIEVRERTLNSVNGGANPINLFVRRDWDYYLSTNFSTPSELSIGTKEVSGDEWDFNAIEEFNGIISDESPFYIFAGYESTVYRIYKSFKNGQWSFLFSPAIAQAIPAGTPLKQAKPKYTVSVQQGLNVQQFVGTTQFDVFQQINNATLVMTNDVIANDKTDDGMGILPLNAITDAHTKSFVNPKLFEELVIRNTAPLELLSLSCVGVKPNETIFNVVGSVGGYYGRVRDTGTLNTPHYQIRIADLRMKNDNPTGIISAVVNLQSRAAGIVSPRMEIVDMTLGALARNTTYTFEFRTRGESRAVALRNVSYRGVINAEYLGLQNAEKTTMAIPDVVKTRLTNIHELLDTVHKSHTSNVPLGSSIYRVVYALPEADGNREWYRDTHAALPGWNIEVTELSHYIKSVQHVPKFTYKAIQVKDFNTADAATAFVTGLQAQYDFALGTDNLATVFVKFKIATLSRTIENLGNLNLEANDKTMEIARSLAKIASDTLIQIADISPAALVLWDELWADISGEIITFCTSSTSKINEINPNYIQRFTPQANQVLIAANIFPKFDDPSGGGGGVWVDYGDTGYFICKEGLMPAFAKAAYTACRDGLPTYEFGFAINVDVPELLQEGDSFTITIAESGNQISHYQIGDAVSLQIIPQKPIILKHASPANSTQLWEVRGSVSGVLPPYVVGLNPVPYIYNGLHLTLAHGGNEFQSGDTFSFATENQMLTVSKNGLGSTELLLQDGQVIVDGLQLSVQRGYSPMFVVGDSFNFKIFAGYGVVNMQKSDDTYYAPSLIDFTISGTVSAWVSAIFMQHQLPSSANIVLQLYNENNVLLQTIPVDYHENQLIALFEPTLAHRFELHISSSANGFINWLWLGEPLRTDNTYTDFSLNLIAKALQGDGINPTLHYQGLGRSGEVVYAKGFISRVDLNNLLQMVKYAITHNSRIAILPNANYPDEVLVAAIPPNTFSLHDDYLYQPNDRDKRRVSFTLPFEEVIIP